MTLRRTEEQHRNAQGLDLEAPRTVLRHLAEAQVEAASAVHDAIETIAKAAEAAAASLRSGNRVAYAAAGSSGLMALADALELPGTFGIPRDRIVVMLAGGTEALVNLAGAVEDDTEEARRAVAAAGLGEGDCLVAVSASGSTPYAVAAIEEAKSRGVTTIAFANNAGTPLVSLADIGVVLATPPELIAGSTRMGAGTAQKIALNMMSTLMAVHLGHVHDGYMINLHADNIKLRERAARMVAAISGCDPQQAHRRLGEAGGSVKIAVLLEAGATDGRAARALLDSSGQNLRAALSLLEGHGASRKHGT
ncbi:N-acetylmuramic acid 6-phosphate etherase [Aquamicrobium sp. LC103]|uniref:N-acetylmuramic acid 6-phosphate etherase n=1 Tax=Aquamicrobium sp. LC103 TaxID=1120658 RepID=UPI00063EC43A|nr:N-acetylmuramic acid 6-phosphate etherase [Aquamicrobium sp. LC103]TKT74776.1 N-acetylmuramic acid 6-phosphate etherase [Aquamicrobium sp. LC103]